jgi:hypothetical protein
MSNIIDTDEYRLLLSGGHLEKVELATCNVICTKAPLGTSIIQVLPIGLGIVALEDYYKFPRGTSNLYFLSNDLSLVWSAELPSSDDVYANRVFEVSEGLICASWNGVTCTICPNTGRILKKVFTK